MSKTNPAPLDILWDVITSTPEPLPDPFEPDDVLHWTTDAGTDPTSYYRHKAPADVLRWWATRLNDGRWVDDMGNVDTHADIVGLLQRQHEDGKLRFLAHYPAKASTVAVDRRPAKGTR